MFTCNQLIFHTILPLAKLQVISVACRSCSLAYITFPLGHCSGLVRGVGASTATPALAVVDFGPTYLVGLLQATYSRATSLRA